MSQIIKYEEKDIEKTLNNQGFKFLTGDINFITYNGKFVKKIDRESFEIIEIINCDWSVNGYPYRFIVSLDSVYLDRSDPETKHIIEDDKKSFGQNFKGRFTTYRMIEALHNYGAYDHILDISGNDLRNMIDYILDASYSYPWIQDYKEP